MILEIADSLWEFRGPSCTVTFCLQHALLKADSGNRSVELKGCRVWVGRGLESADSGLSRQSDSAYYMPSKARGT